MKSIFIFIFSFLLFNVKLTAQLKPDDKNALMKGSVKNFQGKILKNDIVVFSDTKTKKQYKIISDEKGLFLVLLPVNRTYSINYKNFGSEMNYTEFQVPADKNASYEIEIQIDPPKDFNLEAVFFETGKAALKPSSYKQLNELVEFLNAKKTMKIEIQGHTDNFGKKEDNQKLSEDRAKSVVNYLISKGINSERLTAKGYGDTQPVADNNTETGRAKNRRTFLTVISE